MSVSIKRVVYKDCELGGREDGWWLVNHFPSSAIMDAQADQVTITREDLEEHLQEARDCKGDCQFFEGGKERHDEVTKEMEAYLPKLLDEVQKEDPQNHGWTTLEIWW